MNKNKKIILGAISVCIAIVLGFFGAGEFKASITANISDQTITVGDTPSLIVASGGLGGTYAFSLSDGGTGLTGSFTGSTYTFSNPASAIGTAVLAIVYTADPNNVDDVDASTTSTVTVSVADIAINTEEQNITTGSTPVSIVVSGGSGDFSFNFSDAGTGLSGVNTSNTYVFSSPATASGTAILTITDNLSNQALNSVINVSVADIAINTEEQNITTGSTPASIVVSGGSGDFSFNFSDAGTGLSGVNTSNTYVFSSPATGPGTAILTITDNLSNQTLNSVINVSVSSLTIDNISQTISTGEKPVDIVASGGSENFSFSFDDGGTGLQGFAQGANTYSFSNNASSEGTATLSIYDQADTSSSSTASIIVTKDTPLSFIIFNINCKEVKNIGDVCTLVAKGTYPDRSEMDISSSLTWLGYESIGAISEDVDNNVILTINNSGTATISASLDGMLSKNTFDIEVVDENAIKSILAKSTCEEKNPDINDVCVLSAVATYEDGSKSDISFSAEWIGTESIGSLFQYYLTITEEGTASIAARYAKEGESGGYVVSNSILIESGRKIPEIISIRTSGNMSLAEGTHETLYIEAKSVYSIDDLERMEISLIKGEYGSVDQIPNTAQRYDIVEKSVDTSFELTGDAGLIKAPILIPALGDLQNGKHTIIVEIFDVEGNNDSEIYSTYIGIPANGDVNNDGVYSLSDAILAMKFYSKTSEPNQTQLTGIDFDFDGKIGLLDVIGVFRTITSSQQGNVVIFNNPTKPSCTSLGGSICGTNNSCSGYFLDTVENSCCSTECCEPQGTQVCDPNNLSNVYWQTSCGELTQEVYTACDAGYSCSSDDNSQCCMPEASQSCYNGDVYWQNSCGSAGELIETCDIYDNCNDGQCCTLRAEISCHNDLAYWYDSCGNREETPEDANIEGLNCTYDTCVVDSDCASSEICENSQCKYNPVPVL